MVITKCKTALLIKNDYNWPAALVVGMLDILSDAVASILLVCSLLDFNDALLWRREGM